MRSFRLDHPRLWLVLMSAACLSVVPLAWLQYRWIGQISQADRERRQAHLGAAVSRFVREFDGEVGRVLRMLLFGPAPAVRGAPEDLAARYTRFLEAGGEPRLVRNFYASQGGEDGTQELLRMNLETEVWVPVAWPRELEPLRARLLALTQEGTPGPAPPQPPFDDQVLALFAPLWQVLPEPFAPGLGPRRRGRLLAGWVIVELDLEFISKELLPRLVERHFLESGERDYQVRVVSVRQPERTIYTSEPALPAGFFASPDASAPLLVLRPERLPGFGPPGLGRPRFGSQSGAPPSAPGEPLPPVSSEAPAGWRLLVKHRAGSLEAAVVQTHRRNLAISFAILLLMTASLAVLLVSTRRAQRLAHMQMEFVAGVSHELRTPLSVICSAGDNLADGLVAGETQVRRYGSVVRTEGRRLSQMVEQILGFAGIQSGRAKFELQPTVVEEVLCKALAACEPEIRASGCAVESRIAPDLPQVLADATALTHALRNLIDNAVAHGGQGKWLGLQARLAADGTGGRIEILVEDRGRGIDSRDLPHIFDPFYRGRRHAPGDEVRGFGLGLALAKRIVEAHAGTLSVESNPGQGTRFFVRLPALAAPDEETGEPTDSLDRG